MDQPDQVVEANSLTLQDIRSFGGTEKDLQLLEGVDVESASELEFDGSESQNISQQEIQDYIRSIKLDSSSGPTENESRSDATAESEVKLPNEERTTQSKGKRKQLKERPLENKETQGNKATKRITRDSNMERESRTAAEIAELQDEATAPGEGGHTPARGGATAADCDIEGHLLSIAATSYKKLLVGMDAEEPWFVQSATQEPAFPVSSHVMAHLSGVGAELMKSEVQLYEQVRTKNRGAGDVRWLKTVLSSGTLSDKIATLTLLIQESPVHTLASLDTLLSMATKKGKRESVMAVDTLKQLWISNLLPEERKLKFLKQRPLNLLSSIASGTQPPRHPALAAHPARPAHQSLLLWYFEDQLKSKYARFVSILQAQSHDSVINIREKTLGHIFDLLFQRPEQEQVLLSELVNKLGDPAKKVASRAMLFLLKLLNHHVNMKVIVAKEIESLLHRPNISPKAQYYGVCCLNQIVIDPYNEALAAKLIEIYFTFFKVYIQKKQLDSKMLSGLLTGVNRAFPFLKGEIPNFEDHLCSLFRVVHVGPMATGIQSLMLLFQVMESRQAVSGRFYQALYTKLMDPALKHFNRQAMFLNVLFKSLKSDPVLKRVKAFLKRILQVCVFHAPSFVCGCLYVISELLKLKPVLWSFILQSEEADEEHFLDVVEDGEDTARPHSPSAPTTQDPATTTTHPGTPGPPRTVDSRAEAVPSQEEPVATSASTVGQRGEGNWETAVSNEGRSKGPQYQANRRNPLYSGAEFTCLWELGRLTCHYHPSVQRFAQKIASGDFISYSSDPLQDFTLMRFLDRFVYKNPKQKESDHGGSLMQRTSKLTLKTEIPANSAQFASLNEASVRDDEVFMHRYFRQKVALETSSKKRKKKEREEVAPDPVEGAGAEHQDIHLQEDHTDMDFAAEFDKYRRSVGKRRVEEDSSSGESEGEQDNGNEFDYNAHAMDFEEDEGVWGEGGGKGEGEVSEAQLERMLLENLSSNEEEEEGPARKKRKTQTTGKARFDPSSMFAAADEFADILEESGSRAHQTKDNASEKQLWWEERKGQPARYFQKKKKKNNKDSSSGGPKKQDRRDRGHGQDGRTGSKKSKKRERAKQSKGQKKGKGVHVQQQGRSSKKGKKRK